MAGIKKPKITQGFRISLEFRSLYKALTKKFKDVLPKKEYGHISDIDVIEACVAYVANVVAQDPSLIYRVAEFEAEDADE